LKGIIDGFSNQESEEDVVASMIEGNDGAVNQFLLGIFETRSDKQQLEEAARSLKTDKAAAILAKVEANTNSKLYNEPKPSLDFIENYFKKGNGTMDKWLKAAVLVCKLKAEAAINQTHEEDP
jgi:hypothetical protein